MSKRILPRRAPKHRRKKIDEEDEVPSGCASESINKGCVAFYPFKGSADDESGCKNKGTVHGAVFTKDRFDVANSALYFDGKDDYVEIEDDDSLDMRMEISVCAWIRVKSFHKEHDGEFVTKWKTRSTSQGSWCLSTTSEGRVSFMVSGNGNDGSSVAKSRTILVTDVPYHVTGTYCSTDNKIRIYVNGKEEGAKLLIHSGRIFVSNSNVLIGAARYFHKRFFNGTIDSVRIYKRCLSEPEVRNLYHEVDVNEKLMDEILERMETMNTYSDLKVELSNKTLSLWKPLFFEIMENEDLKFNSLSSFSLEVEESVIVFFLLGFRFPPVGDLLSESNILDYFLFFDLLGLDRCVDQVTFWLTEKSRTLSFTDLFTLFRSCATKYESESVRRMLFDDDDHGNNKAPKKKLSFKTLFCETLYIIMKNRESEAITLNQMREKKFLRFFQSKKSSFEEKKKKKKSPEEDDDQPPKTALQIAYERREKTGDLKFITSDGVEFKFHRAILILTSNFFHRMVRFGGAETVEMNETSKIKLHNISSDEMRILLPLYYKVDPKKAVVGVYDDGLLSCVLECAVHSHSFLETETLESILSYYSTLCETVGFDRDTLELSIRKAAPKLFGCDEVIKRVVAAASGLSEVEVMRWVGESSSENRYEMLVKENQALKERMALMEERMESLEKLVRENSMEKKN